MPILVADTEDDILEKNIVFKCEQWCYNCKKEITFNTKHGKSFKIVEDKTIDCNNS